MFGDDNFEIPPAYHSEGRCRVTKYWRKLCN